MARASRAGASFGDGRLPCPALPAAESFIHTGPFSHMFSRKNFPPPPKMSVTPTPPSFIPYAAPIGNGRFRTKYSAPSPPPTSSSAFATRNSFLRRIPAFAARSAAHQWATPSPFVSSVPRPYRKPSRTCAENGGTLHSSAFAGTTSMWWMRTSPGSSVPPTWHRTFGFSGFTPNVTGESPSARSASQSRSAAPRQSPGGFDVSIRTYSESSATGSVIEVPPVSGYIFLTAQARPHRAPGDTRMPKALITGVTGQDGSYLAEFLLSKGYEVHGIIRRASTFNTGRLDHIYVDPHAAGARMFLHYGDLSDGGQLTNLIYNVQPDEIYHLGAQSHVRVSFDIPEYTGDVTGLGTTRILESLRRAGGKARYYQASSSEMFGATPPPQGEKTPFYPRSPYGAAKVYSYWMAVNYREAYGMFASNGILFNHESPRRGETFVTRKITRAIARIKAGKQKELFLGNLDARRDWGFAYEYVQAMWRILQHDRGDDFVIGTGQSNSVKEFLEEAFAYAGLDWKEYVKIDPKYFRPTEVENLIADASKAKRLLGWEPKVTFKELVRIMVDADLEDAGLPTPGEGRKILAAKGLPVASKL